MPLLYAAADVYRFDIVLVCWDDPVSCQTILACLTKLGCWQTYSAAQQERLAFRAADYDTERDAGPLIELVDCLCNSCCCTAWCWSHVPRFIVSNAKRLAALGERNHCNSV